MQMAITFMAVVAGLIFSIAVALLAEEFIFGQVFRLFFTPARVAPICAEQNGLHQVPQAVPIKSGQKR
jgi:ABC-type enterobactin transport system permease subunit